MTEPKVRRTLKPVDLLDIGKALEQVLQKTGIIPHPPVDLEGQRRLGLQTLVHSARNAAYVLSQVKVEVDGKPTYPHNKLSTQLSAIIEEIEKEWRL